MKIKHIKTRKDMCGLGKRCYMGACFYHEQDTAPSLCKIRHQPGTVMKKIDSSGGHYYFCMTHPDADCEQAVKADSRKSKIK